MPKKLLTKRQIQDIKEHPGYYADTLALEAAATMEAMSADLALMRRVYKKRHDNEPICDEEITAVSRIGSRWKSLGWLEGNDG